MLHEGALVRRTGLLAGAAATVAVAMALLVVCAFALGSGRWIAAPRWLPLVGSLLVVGTTAFVGRVAYTRATRSGDTRGVAQAIERSHALRAGAVQAGLELEGTGALADAGTRALDDRLRAKSGALAPGLRREASRLTLRAGVAMLLAATSLVLATRSHSDGLRALMQPLGAWRGDLLPVPAFGDLPTSVARGRAFTARVSAPGRRTVVLRQRETGTAWRERKVELAADGKAAVALGPLAADAHLVLTDGRATSAEHVVRVTDRAYVGNVVVVAAPPAYLGGSSERMPADLPLRVPRGTRLTVSGEGSVALRDVRLASGADTLSLGVTGQRFSGTFHAERDSRWEWIASAVDGGDVERPVALDVEVVADSMPQIEIALPVNDTIVMADGRTALRLVASDDHGLGSVGLIMTRATGNAQVREIARSLPARWAADAALDAAALGLRPGDAVRVTAQATDNSPWSQTSHSRTVVIRLPGIAEQREMARASADSLARAASAAVGAERDLAKRTSEAARSRGERATKAAARNDRSAATAPPNDAMSYEAEQRARALRSEQQSLSQAVEKMREQAKSLERSLDRAGAMDSALASRLAEAQQLLREAMTPEMAKALAGLDTALQSRQGDRTRESLADLAREQEKLRAQLERIAEMLGRAAIEGTLETLRDEATDVATAERAAADSAARGTLSPNDARRLADRAAALAKGVDKLGERLKQAGGEQTAQVTAQAGKLASGSSDDMRRAANAAPTDASASAQQASEQMTKAAEQLGRARAQQIGAWKSELANELDRSIQEMLQLANEQRSLEERSRAGAPPGSLRSEQSALQQGVEKTSERLERAARASSLVSGGSRRSVSEARSQTARATDESAKPNGRPSNATNAMADAADALTRAAASLVKDRERVNSSSSATGFAEMLREMQELAKKQGSLNGQSAGLFQMPSSQSADAREGARQMAREQRGVARSLDELGDADGSGRTEALAAEARRVADALERGDLSAATRERQEKLFKRMLDAGRSLEGDERDDQGKREATSATGVDVFTPTDGTARGAAASKFREPAWDDLRGLSAEERRAVIDYFRRLNGATHER